MRRSLHCLLADWVVSKSRIRANHGDRGARVTMRGGDNRPERSRRVAGSSSPTGRARVSDFNAVEASADGLGLALDGRTRFQRSRSMRNRWALSLVLTMSLAGCGSGDITPGSGGGNPTSKGNAMANGNAGGGTGGGADGGTDGGGGGGGGGGG